MSIRKRASTFHRNRLLYAGVVAGLIAIGLPSRLVDRLPVFYEQYVGDGLWAATIFFLIALLLPKSQTLRIALAAFSITWAIEFSQFYQADWINAVRGVKMGGLILGYTFRWTDLVAYSTGISAGVILEKKLLMRNDAGA